MALKPLALNCALKADAGKASSTDAMIAVLEKAFAAGEVSLSETVRVVRRYFRRGRGRRERCGYRGGGGRDQQRRVLGGRAELRAIPEDCGGSIGRSELRERFVAQAGRTRTGPKLEDATDMGPLVDSRLADALVRGVRAMRKAGATLLAGGDVDGTHMRPTWLGGLPSSHPSLTHELFGPVATIEAVSDNADLLDQLAAGADAIHAAVFTRSIALVTRAFQTCNAAALLVNDSTDFRIDAMPFGGIGAAGLGREGVADAVAAISEKKM